MALAVPKPQVEIVKKFLQFPDDKIAGFLDALSKAGPHFNIQDLTLAVVARPEFPKDLVTVLGIVPVLGSLYLTKDAQHTPREAFIDKEVFAALKRDGAFTEGAVDAEWKKLRKFLVDALSLEDILGTAAKAGYILTQHERIYLGARFMTDVRPIFHENLGEKPHSAVIIHMMEIMYRDLQGRRFEQFFALDSTDVRTLKSLIERALKKEETLKSVMGDAQVTVLYPKETF